MAETAETKLPQRKASDGDRVRKRAGLTLLDAFQMWEEQGGPYASAPGVRADMEVVKLVAALRPVEDS